MAVHANASGQLGCTQGSYLQQPCSCRPFAVTHHKVQPLEAANVSSHHLSNQHTPVCCSSIAPLQFRPVTRNAAKQQHSARFCPWFQSPVPAGPPASRPTAAAPSRRAATPRPWPIQLSISTGPMVGQGELRGQPQLPPTGSGVWGPPTVSGSSCCMSWRGLRRERRISRRESGGARAQRMLVRHALHAWKGQSRRQRKSRHETQLWCGLALQWPLHHATHSQRAARDPQQVYQLGPRPGKVAAKQLMGVPRAPAVAQPAGWPTATLRSPMGCSQCYPPACTALCPCKCSRQHQRTFALTATYLIDPAYVMSELLCH